MAAPARQSRRKFADPRNVGRETGELLMLTSHLRWIREFVPFCSLGWFVAQTAGSLLTIACSSSNPADVPTTSIEPSISVKSLDATIEIDTKSMELRLQQKGKLVLVLPLGQLQFGASGDPTLTNYDPYPLLVETALRPVPEGLTWSSPKAISGYNKAGDTLTVGFDGYSLQIRPTLSGFALTAKTSLKGDFGYIRFAATMGTADAIYGLGEHFDDVNSRGKIRAMQIEQDSELESSYNEVHAPIPLVIGARSPAYGLYVADSHPMVFDVGKTKSDVLDVIVGTGKDTSAGLTFHLFAEDRPIDITRHYYEVTGAPELPAAWTYGPLIWRDENKDQAEVVADADAVRKLDLATSGMWIDRPYATAVQTFDFDPKMFTDAAGMVKTLHDKGLRVGVWHVPYLDEKDANTLALRKEATSLGYYPKSVGLPLNKWGKPIDFTLEAARTWWKSQLKKYTDIGIDGYKLDYGEDVVPGFFKAGGSFQFNDGTTEQTQHFGYVELYHRTYGETLPAKNKFLICRHVVPGDQKNAPIVWPGDLDASFAKHRDVLVKKDGSKTAAVGGLPASVVAGMSLGPSGFAFFGADTGGYRGDAPDKELFVRWFEQTALSTVMQVGNGSSTLPWDSRYDAELVDLYRVYARLHLRLFPTLWSYAERNMLDGRAIQRPLGLMYPELAQHPNDEYLLGDDLLVAPVMVRGATSRSVLFPPGMWVDWWNGSTQSAGLVPNVAAPLGTLPLYQREGSIVALLRPTIDTLSPTKVADVESYADDSGILWARVAPGDANSFVLFDKTELRQVRAGSVVTLTSKAGTKFTKGVVFELRFAKKPDVRVNGVPAVEDLLLTKDGSYRLRDGVLEVRVGFGATVEIR